MPDGRARHAPELASARHGLQLDARSEPTEDASAGAG
jgi:hypothetical protein